MKTTQLFVVNYIDEIIEDDFISIVSNPFAIIKQRLHRDNNTAFVALDREWVIDHFPEWKEKYKLILEQEREYDPDKEWEDII